MRGQEGGKGIKETYVDMVKSTITIAKAMKYPGASAVEAEDVLESIQDLKCNAWRKHMQGITTMEPEEVVMENDVPENEEDLGHTGPYLKGRIDTSSSRCNTKTAKNAYCRHKSPVSNRI